MMGISLHKLEVKINPLSFKLCLVGVFSDSNEESNQQGWCPPRTCAFKLSKALLTFILWDCRLYAKHLLKCVPGFLEKGRACVMCHLQHIFSLSYTHGISAVVPSHAVFLAPPHKGLQHWGGTQQTNK